MYAIVPGRLLRRIIVFMGRIEYTGYVTQITKHGQPAYHIDLPGKPWGGHLLAWVEHAASAWFSKRPVTEASVRRQWEARVRAAAERARQEAEWQQRAERGPALATGVRVTPARWLRPRWRLRR